MVLLLVFVTCFLFGFSKVASFCRLIESEMETSLPSDSLSVIKASIAFKPISKALRIPYEAFSSTDIPANIDRRFCLLNGSTKLSRSTAKIAWMSFSSRFILEEERSLCWLDLETFRC